jgi:hypothetical protein
MRWKGSQADEREVSGRKRRGRWFAGAGKTCGLPLGSLRWGMRPWRIFGARTWRAW